MRHSWKYRRMVRDRAMQDGMTSPAAAESHQSSKSTRKMRSTWSIIMSGIIVRLVIVAVILANSTMKSLQPKASRSSKIDAYDGMMDDRSANDEVYECGNRDGFMHSLSEISKSGVDISCFGFSHEGCGGGTFSLQLAGVMRGVPRKTFPTVSKKPRSSKQGEKRV